MSRKKGNQPDTREEKPAGNLRAQGEGSAQSARLSVRVTPRSSRNGFIKYEDGCAHIRVSAPPVDSAANAACCEVVAGLAGVRESQVSIIGGAHNRNKVISIEGISAEDLAERLSKAVAS